jgi:hypothetical protein
LLALLAKQRKFYRKSSTKPAEPANRRRRFLIDARAA